MENSLNFMHDVSLKKARASNKFLAKNSQYVYLPAEIAGNRGFEAMNNMLKHHPKHSEIIGTW